MAVLAPSIKVCGICDPSLLRPCYDLGVNAIGVIAVPGSPRYVDPDLAQKILSIARGCRLVTVFVFQDAKREDIVRYCAKACPDYVQFHGKESASYCRSFKLPYFKACSVEQQLTQTNQIDEVSLQDYYQEYDDASAILLDVGRGGTGQTWNWQPLPKHLLSRTIIAGGLGPDNVCQAIQRTGCRAMDLNSGVESTPGVKDIDLIKTTMGRLKDTIGKPTPVFQFEAQN